MLLQALVKYYEILAEDEESDIPKVGYSRVSVSYALNISENGELLNVIPLKIASGNGKKLVPQKMTLPEQVTRSSGVSSNFLCDASSYVLGFDSKGKPKRSEKCFEAFKKLHNEILADTDCDEAKAVLSFLNHWDIKIANTHPAIADYLEDIYGGANFIFKLDGDSSFVHQNKKIKKAWERYKEASSAEQKMQCLVTGEQRPIARLHPKIKGVKGGQAVGCSLVSFNATAYESYGKSELQGLNSPVSEYAAFAYTTVLNSMLADNAHKLNLGDSTVVFWAESPDVGYQDIMSIFFEPAELDTIGTDKQRYIRDPHAVKNIKSIFEKIASGRKIALDGELDKDVRFHILGLSPNAARLSVRFFVSDSFGNFLDKIARHYQDLSIEKQFGSEPNSISLWKLLNETVSPSSKDKSASPLLAGSVLRSILSGLPYPAALYNAVMVRIRAEKDINYYKAAIIKAYLARLNNKYRYEEVLNLGLNEKSTNKAYTLGRLFAVLEKAQLDANPGIKATIKDRYFTSACGTPSSVFPLLLRLSNHHISKAEYGYTSENKIKDIMQIFEVDDTPFPRNLSLEDQGIFILGYYHQKNSFYKKQEEK